MTGEEHYEHAEALLAQAEAHDVNMDLPRDEARQDLMELIARADVHAKLAQVAATRGNRAWHAPREQPDRPESPKTAPPVATAEEPTVTRKKKVSTPSRRSGRA